ncbi:MAG: hypothetical protein ACHQ5A_10455, partial [Opitutales bacterium]
MPARLSLLYCLLAIVARAQALPVTVLNDPLTVSSVGAAATAVNPQLQAEISRQQEQIDAATLLNRSLGYWGHDVGGVDSPCLQTGSLARDYLQDLRSGLILDYRPPTPATLASADGTPVSVAPADLADFNQLDQIGAGTNTTLAALAEEIAGLNREIAGTYAAMIAHGQTQQKYEKYRGKLRALKLHLENLQAQERSALDFLRAQATLRTNQLARSGEIAALVQEADHRETVTGVSA